MTVTPIRPDVPDVEDPVLHHVCRCGAARHRHAGKRGAGRCLGHIDGQPAPCPAECERFRHDPDDRILRRAIAAAGEHPSVALRGWGMARDRARQRAKVKHGEGSWSVGPSDFSSCLKAIEYRERPPEGYEPQPVDKAAANIGTLIHNAYTASRRRRYPWRKFDVTAHVPGLDRPGKIDEWDPIIGRVTDYKTKGDYAWEKLGKEGVPDADWKQTRAYGLALEDAGETVVDLEIIAINRENGRSERFIRAYSREQALRDVGELHAILDALDAGRPLPRVRAGDELLGPTVNALCARYCPAVRHCWDLPNVPEERSPEGWLLARDDEGVAAALKMYDDERAVGTEAEKRKKYARTLLEGVEPGRYGDLTLAWSGGNLGDPKPDVASRCTQLEMELTLARAEGRVPKGPEDLPYPEVRKRSSVTIQVKPVRAAKLEVEQAEADAAPADTA